MNTSEELPLIWIKKITRNNEIEDDVLRKSDIKRIRRWHKNEKNAGVDGDICAVTIDKAKGLSDVIILVNEPLESLAIRLGNVDKLVIQ